jgi:ABC-2 type transport system permease protein
MVMRREIVVFLLQTLIQPLFFLFVFGKVLSTIGAASASFSTVLLPGVVALTVFLTALQGPAIDLARDLNVIREIDDPAASRAAIANAGNRLGAAGCCCTSFVLCLWGGLKLFHRRVVS